MATWSARTGAGLREGLTVYQLQELVRTGQVGASDEVLTEGAWRRVDEVPPLRALLPSAPPVGGDLPEPKTIRVGALTLEVGPDGKPRPPPPDVVAQLLAQDLGDRRPHWGWKAALAVAAAVFLFEVGYALWSALGAPEP